MEGASQKKKKKGSKADNFDPNKSKSLKLFVATKFPEWQDLVVEAIKQNYDEVCVQKKKKKFPKKINGNILVLFNCIKIRNPIHSMMVKFEHI